MFQSAPGAEAGRNDQSDGSRDAAAEFQSAPGAEAGRNEPLRGFGIAELPVSIRPRR